MPEATRLVTAGELEKFPRDDRRYELVDGRIIPMSPVAYPRPCGDARCSSCLISCVRSRNLGEVMTEVGFTLRTDPDTVRAPDVAFLRREANPGEGAARVLEGHHPDLAAEVLSPDDRPGRLERRSRSTEVRRSAGAGRRPG